MHFCPIDLGDWQSIQLFGTGYRKKTNQNHWSQTLKTLKIQQRILAGQTEQLYHNTNFPQMSQSKGFTQPPAVLFIPLYWTGHSHLRCPVPSFQRFTTVLVQSKTETCSSENCKSTWPPGKVSSDTQAMKIRSKLQNPFPRQHLSWNTIINDYQSWRTELGN